MKRILSKIYHTAGGLITLVGSILTFYGAAMVDTADLSAGTRYAVCGLCVTFYGVFLANWEI